jgi:hypothetical protein
MRTTIIFLFLFLSQSLFAQVNIMGKPGYINIPTARWDVEKPLGLSYAFIPSGYGENVLYTPRISTDPLSLSVYGIRASLTSFLEVNFIVAHRPSISEKIGVGDRQLDLRFRLFKERKIFPSVVLGLTPPGSISPALAQDYMVISKNFWWSEKNLNLSFGYGLPFAFKKENNASWLLDGRYSAKSKLGFGNYLNGFFGGLAFTPFRYGGVMLEYDSHTVNAGAYFKPWNWLNLQAYTYEGKEWGFSAALSLSLNLPPKSLRDYAKDLD